MTSKSSNTKLQPISVLVLVSANTFAGPIKGTAQLVQSHSRSGFRVLFCNIVTENADTSDFIRGIEPYGIHSIILRRKGRDYLELLKRISSIVDTEKIDIIQTHSFLPSFIAWGIKWIMSIHWICFMHGTTAENIKIHLFNIIDAFQQLRADRVILVANYQRAKIPGGYYKNRVLVIPNGIQIDDPVRCSTLPCNIHQQLNISDSEFIIAIVSRLSPEKGVDLFVEAISIAVRGQPNIHAIIVGDGQQRRALEQQVADKGLLNHISFTGYCTTPGDFMRSSNCIVLSSRSEGIPNVALEAMALGIPVIATAVGGVPDIIENGISGILVPKEDPIALSHAILHIISNPASAYRLGMAGKLRVERNFNSNTRCKSIQAILKSICINSGNISNENY